MIFEIDIVGQVQIEGGITINKNPLGRKVEDGLNEPKTKMDLEHKREGTTKIK